MPSCKMVMSCSCANVRTSRCKVAAAMVAAGTMWSNTICDLWELKTRPPFVNLRKAWIARDCVDMHTGFVRKRPWRSDWHIKGNWKIEALRHKAIELDQLREIVRL